MAKIFVINFDKGICREERDLEWENVPLQEFCTNILALAEGLEDPVINVESEDVYDLHYHHVYISGTRAMTEQEIHNEKAQRDLNKRRLEHMRSFKG